MRDTALKELGSERSCYTPRNARQPGRRVEAFVGTHEEPFEKPPVNGRSSRHCLLVVARLSLFSTTRSALHLLYTTRSLSDLFHNTGRILLPISLILILCCNDVFSSIASCAWRNGSIQWSCHINIRHYLRGHAVSELVSCHSKRGRNGVIGAGCCNCCADVAAAGISSATPQ